MKNMAEPDKPQHMVEKKTKGKKGQFSCWIFDINTYIEPEYLIADV
jgi:hypothetical protein